MPIMNGLEATKLIKEFRPNLTIVAQTVYSTIEERIEAISAGYKKDINCFMQKYIKKSIFLLIFYFRFNIK